MFKNLPRHFAGLIFKQLPYLGTSSSSSHNFDHENRRMKGIGDYLVKNAQICQVHGLAAAAKTEHHLATQQQITVGKQRCVAQLVAAGTHG